MSSRTGGPDVESGNVQDEDDSKGAERVRAKITQLPTLPEDFDRITDLVKAGRFTSADEALDQAIAIYHLKKATPATANK